MGTRFTYCLALVGTVELHSAARVAAGLRSALAAHRGERGPVPVVVVSPVFLDSLTISQEIRAEYPALADLRAMCSEKERPFLEEAVRAAL